MVFGPVPAVGWLGAAGWLAGSRVAVVGVAVAGGGWVRVAGSWPAVVRGGLVFGLGLGLWLVVVGRGAAGRLAGSRGSWPAVSGGEVGFRAGAGLREIHLEPESPF